MKEGRRDIPPGATDRRSKLLSLAAFSLHLAKRPIEFKRESVFQYQNLAIENNEIQNWEGRGQMLILFDCSWVIKTVTVLAQ